MNVEKQPQRIIHISKAVVRKPEWRMARPVDFTLCDGEHIAVIGPNGGGKSMFIDIITGSHPLLMHDPEYDFSPRSSRLACDNIRHITFRDMYGGDSDRTYYLQQRWNQAEIDANTPTVGSVIAREYDICGADTARRRAFTEHLYDLFDIRGLLDKYIICLSSGEMRKLRLIRALMTEPRVLIMDNPYIGLDASTRSQLTELLTVLSRERALQIIIVVSRPGDIPPFITHVVEVKDMIVGDKVTSDEYRATLKPAPAHILSEEKAREIIGLPYKDDDYNAAKVIDMHDLCIRYGNRTILENLSWTVRNGERWALSGENGSGKSTLLSLVCADNPQGYACDITLFDRRRGSGESIWDIKRHIGYVSPELHRSYHRDIPAIKIVASGLKDSVGLYVRPDSEEYASCRRWMSIFGLEGLEDTSFLRLSGGQQRLVLLARAFVKDPELLILDEPLHGLDDVNSRLVREIIDTFCRRRNKTLIMVSHYREEFPECIGKSLYLKKHI